MWAKRLARSIVVFCGIVVLAAGLVAISGWQSAIAPITPPSATSFDASSIKRGAELAALGDCDVCHTAPGGSEFAGGLGIPTPFGTIYSTNITPDAETGIGNWSEAAFRRALRDGVARDGSYLYPAFPYDHFTLVSDDDDKALYAFLMSRRPVHAVTPANTLPFPLNVRSVMFGWNKLFLHIGPYQADAAHDALWNRGAYLTEGLGHCGACHTPRNFLGAEKSNAKFAGGNAEGWTAYALDASSPAPVPWNVDTLTHYLSRGFEDVHGVARGPMAQVANDLRAVPESDVHAIATYVSAQMSARGPETARIEQQAQAQSRRGTVSAAASADSQADTLHGNAAGDQGAVIYAATCAGCHEGPRAMPFGGIDLALSSGLSGPSPDNLFNVVLYGLPATNAAHAPIMPGFANALNDNQLVALARYLRARFTGNEPWTGIQDSLRKARAAMKSPAPDTASAPPGTTQRTANEAQH